MVNNPTPATSFSSQKPKGLGRRSLLMGSAGAAASAMAAFTASPVRAQETLGITNQITGSTITPTDPQYVDLTTGNNARYVARPEYVQIITSTEEAREAVQAAVDAGKKVSVRSGGHCFADFVCNPEVEVILDLSAMVGVSYDKEKLAFSVEPGARLSHVYELLFKQWGVTIPGGICYSVGAGGHIVGGGYGLLSRSHGLVVDHLYAVEVVTVNKYGKASVQVATRDSHGRLGDLWWAHTGGGGGNFGIVTKYWFRSPGAKGSNPSDQLIKAPSEVLVNALSLPWDQIDENKFRKLMNNWGEWHEEFRDPGTPESHLSSLFNLNHKAHGSLDMFTQIDASVRDASGVMERFINKITDGVDVESIAMVSPNGELPALPDFHKTRRISWMQATRTVGTNNPVITDPTSRGAHKSAYFKKRFTDAQLRVLWKQMTRGDFSNPNTMMVIFSFGGAVNAVPKNATANVQRDSIFKICLQTFWNNESEDEFYLNWMRETYESMFADLGGVPVPNTQVDGCYINYPDTDIADNSRNRSGVSWSYLYYQGNYKRLQQTKKYWDPKNFFTHKLGIEIPK